MIKSLYTRVVLTFLVSVIGGRLFLFCGYMAVQR